VAEVSDFATVPALAGSVDDWQEFAVTVLCSAVEP
jgi:hypothetical protein